MHNRRPRPAQFGQLDSTDALALAFVGGVVRFLIWVAGGILGTLAAGLWVTLRWLVPFLARHPRFTLALAAVLATLVALGAIPAAVVVAATGFFAARRWSGDNASLGLGDRLRTAWRTVRWFSDRAWRESMIFLGLAARLDGFEHLPRRGRIRSNKWVDRVHVQLVHGQQPADFELRAASLAHSFGAEACKVASPRPGWLWLTFQRRDPLTSIVRVNTPTSAEDVDLAAVPVGLTENGDPWRLQILHRHWLVGGAMDAGKSGFLWALINGVAPLVRDGRMLLVGVDPKGGMELGPGRALFHRFARPEQVPDEPTAAVFEPLVATLEWAAAACLERSERLFQAGARKYQPTTEDPAVMIIVDELALITSYLPDPALRKRAYQALAVVLSQGRAPGFTVIGALQDPRKDVIPLRDLFPGRFALRTTEAQHADMILGDGARQRGAATEQIPDDLPGLGYVLSDGERDPLRVRVGWNDDTDIARLVCDYRPLGAEVIDLHAPEVPEDQGVPA